MLCGYIISLMALTAGWNIPGAYGENMFGICFYGDPGQGRPCNLVSETLNDFPGVGNPSFATCIINNFISFVFSNEQRRMHKSFCTFSSDKWYDGKLLTAPGRHGKLSDENPKLFGALCRIAGLDFSAATDDALRFMYLEVEGIRRKSKTAKSCVVLEVSAFFYLKLYEYLHHACCLWRQDERGGRNSLSLPRHQDQRAPGPPGPPGAVHCDQREAQVGRKASVEPEAPSSRSQQRLCSRSSISEALPKVLSRPIRIATRVPVRAC
jgi:hypothetical protein